MVARDRPPGDAAGTSGRGLRELVAAVFLMWRRWLTAVVPALGKAGRGALSAALTTGTTLAAAAAFVRAPSKPMAEDARRRVAVLGLASLGLGAALPIGLARPLGLTLVMGVEAAVWMLVWAPIRLAIIRLAAPGLPSHPTRRAWAAGLLPSFLGVTAILDAVVLAASAWLTFAALRGAGADKRDARAAAGWAFGAQAVAEVTRWLAEGALFYLLFLRARG